MYNLFNCTTHLDLHPWQASMVFLESFPFPIENLPCLDWLLLAHCSHLAILRRIATSICSSYVPTSGFTAAPICIYTHSVSYYILQMH